VDDDPHVEGTQPGEPKAEMSRRTVPLPISTVEVMRAHRSRHAAYRLAAAGVRLDNDLVFVLRDGRRSAARPNDAGHARTMPNACQW
jgi:hypothetical protein